MKPLLIGSQAIKFHFPHYSREPKDWDYIVPEWVKWGEEPWKNVNSNGERVEYFHNKVLSDRYYNRGDRMDGHGVISADDLYTLKLSHLVGWDIFWEKNLMTALFLQEQGCELDIQLFNQLYQHWNEVHGVNKRSDLEMSADNFFDNALPKLPLSHDELHTILNPTPTYTKVLADGAEVEVSEEKFNALTNEDKIALVQEEVMIMGWERKFHRDYRVCYGIMLRKFVRNHAPIWEALWILQNWDKVYKPPYNYYKKIDEALCMHNG